MNKPEIANAVVFDGFAQVRFEDERWLRQYCGQPCVSQVSSLNNVGVVEGNNAVIRKGLQKSYPKLSLECCLKIMVEPCIE